MTDSPHTAPAVCTPLGGRAGGEEDFPTTPLIDIGHDWPGPSLYVYTSNYLTYRCVSFQNIIGLKTLWLMLAYQELGGTA
jgi:hypothetical protein